MVFGDEVLSADEGVGSARRVDAATQYRSIRAWGDEGSGKLPLACKPSERRGLDSSSGKEANFIPPMYYRCSSRLNWSNLHAGPDFAEASSRQAAYADIAPSLFCVDNC